MNINVRQIEFKSANGQNAVFGWIYLPDAPRGMVQIIHGMAEHMGRYHDFMRYLAQNGYAACGIDQIGHGRSAQDGRYGFFSEQDGWKRLLDDQHRFQKIARSEAPGLPCALLGHSMGSFEARLYAARYPGTLDGLVLVGTARAGLRTDLALRMAVRSARKNGPYFVDRGLNRTVFGGFNDRFQPSATGCDWLSRDAESVRRYVEDPECGFVFTASAFRDLFTLLSAANEPKCFSAAGRELPILLLAGDQDPVGDYGAGPSRVYDRYVKAGVKDVELVLYDGARHELLGETNREQVWSGLLEWLGDHVGADRPEGAAALEPEPPEEPGEDFSQEFMEP